MLSTKRSNRQFAIVVVALFLLGVSGLVWAQSRFTRSETATGIHAASASAISPMGLLLKASEPLPTESWDAF
jgi:hypothetical protein